MQLSAASLVESSRVTNYIRYLIHDSASPLPAGSLTYRLFVVSEVPCYEARLEACSWSTSLSKSSFCIYRPRLAVGGKAAMVLGDGSGSEGQGILPNGLLRTKVHHIPCQCAEDRLRLFLRHEKSAHTYGDLAFWSNMG